MELVQLLLLLDRDSDGRLDRCITAAASLTWHPVTVVRAPWSVAGRRELDKGWVRPLGGLGVKKFGVGFCFSKE